MSRGHSFLFCFLISGVKKISLAIYNANWQVTGHLKEERNVFTFTSSQLSVSFLRKLGPHNFLQEMCNIYSEIQISYLPLYVFLQFLFHANTPRTKVESTVL